MKSTYYWTVLLCASVSSAAQADALNLLPGLIQQALIHHPSSESAQHLQQAAQQGVKAARWQYFPKPSLHIKQVHSNDKFGDEQTAQLKLTQTLYAGGGIDAVLMQAKAQLAWQEATNVLHKTDIATQVLDAYYQWHSAELKQALLSSAQTRYQTLKERLERRIQQGLSPPNEVLLIHTQLSKIKADIKANHIQQTIALSQLSRLTGRTPEQPIEIQMVRPYSINSDDLSPQHSVIHDHPSLRQLQAQIQIKLSHYQQQKALLLPQVTLSADRQWDRQSSADSHVQLELFTRFGAGLSTHSNSNKAQLEYLAAKSDWQAQQQLISAQFERRWQEYRSLLQQQPLLEAALLNAQQTEASQERQLLAGRKTWRDVVNATQEVLQLELDIAEIKARHVYLSWRLAMDMQGVEAIGQFE